MEGERGSTPPPADSITGPGRSRRGSAKFGADKNKLKGSQQGDALLLLLLANQGSSCPLLTRALIPRYLQSNYLSPTWLSPDRIRFFLFGID
ncbi:unnamed protein product [Nezara viridula]|uniref:Uncharacterized protein n=1 Tax=Nezara viridula TaxID=85310 RepID=A0A9P0HLP1_NEZVI|nr:unnamed protein product [Nezara viridula]